MISKYIELFGTKKEAEGLPTVYIPSDFGWIAAAQEDMENTWSEGSKEQQLLRLLSEQYFQRMFGRKRLPFEYAMLVSNWDKYGLDNIGEAAATIQNDVEYFLYTRIPDWVKSMDALYSEYDPIANYNRHEEGSDTLTYTGSETDTKAGSEEMAKTGSEELAKSGTETMTKSGSEISTPAGSETVTVQNNVNGYNSSTSVPASDSTSTTEYEEGRSDTLSFDERDDTLSFDQRKDTTSFNNRKDTLTFNQRTDTHSFTDRADTREWESDISGNVGVTTSQQMIHSELELRRTDLMLRFHKEIADRFLLSVY